MKAFARHITLVDKCYVECSMHICSDIWTMKWCSYNVKTNPRGFKSVYQPRTGSTGFILRHLKDNIQPTFCIMYLKGIKRYLQRNHNVLRHSEVLMHIHQKQDVLIDSNSLRSDVVIHLHNEIHRARSCSYIILNKRFPLLLACRFLILLTVIIIFSYLNLEAMLTLSAEPLCVVCVSMG